MVCPCSSEERAASGRSMKPQAAFLFTVEGLRLNKAASNTDFAFSALVPSSSSSLISGRSVCSNSLNRASESLSRSSFNAAVLVEEESTADDFVSSGKRYTERTNCACDMASSKAERSACIRLTRGERLTKCSAASVKRRKALMTSRLFCRFIQPSARQQRLLISIPI